MAIVINGKPYAECLAALQSKRPTKKPKGSTGYWYYPIEEFVSAMDEVFGNEHYNLAFSDPVYRKVESGQEAVTVRCTLTLVDDEGKVAKRVDGFGDKEVQYAKNGGRADLGNLTSSAATNAVKDACKYLGIFGYRTEAKPENSKGGKDAPKQSTTTEQKATGGKKPEVSANFVVTDMFYDQGPDNKGNPVWKLPVVNRADGAKCEVIFYHNQVQSKAEKFNKLYAHVEKSFAEGKGIVTCKLKVSTVGDRDGTMQLVFKDFAA